MKISKPTGRMVEETVHRTLVVWVAGQYVVYVYQRAQITLSVTGARPDDSHLEQGQHIPGDLAVLADVTCGGGSDWVTTHGSSVGIALVQEAIPELYAGLSDTEERKALRSINRHLATLAARPERSGPMERMERGQSLAEVAELWMMNRDSLRRVLMSEVDEQHRFGHIDTQRHAQLMRLLDVPDDVVQAVTR